MERFIMFVMGIGETLCATYMLYVGINEDDPLLIVLGVIFGIFAGIAFALASSSD